MVKLTKEEKKMMLEKLNRELIEQTNRFESMSMVLKTAITMRKAMPGLAKDKSLNKSEKSAIEQMNANEKRIAVFKKFVEWTKESFK